MSDRSTRVLSRFDPAVAAWFRGRFTAPSPVQEMGWPIIGSGHDALLCAPTGSGKTLAAFLWSIDRLVAEARLGALRDKVSVLYVSPLKALANDIRLNLEEPLRGVGAHEPLATRITAGLRTGDTPAAERNAMVRRPPHILVTTPESLFILLTSERFRPSLAAVRWIIVDELHALAGNKRGAHLAVTLARLDRLVTANGGSRPIRIGLSATLNPIEELGRFLVGCDPTIDGPPRGRICRIVWPQAVGPARPMDLQVVAPGPELGPLATHEHWDAMYDQVAELISTHRTTLIFTLSRRWAERVALALQKRLGPDAVMAHHGSVARAERLAAEQRLKRGELKAIVATSSLELGIDVGSVDLVCQIDSPKSISAALQRIGRSGHALQGTPKGRFFALTLDDMIECAAAIRAIRGDRLDRVEIPEGCLDVAAQQIVAIAAEEGEVTERGLLLLLRAAYNFRNLQASELRKMLVQMASEPPRRVVGALPRIFYDPTQGGFVRPRRGARLAAITSGGTIPETGNYDVVIESQQRKIGDVEEDFAQESARGDIFALGSMPWRIRGISRGRLMVEPAPGMAPTLPFWITEAAGRSAALSAEVCELRHAIAARLDCPDQAAAWLEEQCALDRDAARQATAYVARGLAALGALPDERTLVFERFFDGLGGTQIVIHAPMGIRFNRGLGLALRKKLCQSFDFEIQASATDDGVLLALNSRHSFPLEETAAMLKVANARDTLIQALLAAPMFEIRFRHVASRALSVLRQGGGKRIPPYLQRLRAQDLTVALFPAQQACFENRSPHTEIPDHFIVTEAVRECLTESTDGERLVGVLAAIENGSIRCHSVDSISPSVFAQRLLLAWDYSFLDDGERANRRSRTVMMNRGLAEEVFRSQDLSAMLARNAVVQAVDEATGRASSRQARSSDELYEIIRHHGLIGAGELAERTSGAWEALLAPLEHSGRVLRFTLAPTGKELLAVNEDAAMIAAAYPGTSFNRPLLADLTIDCAVARDELIRRKLATSGPVSAEELARQMALTPAEIEQGLAQLEAHGKIFRGHFTRADELQWCDREVLERIHRLTLNQARAEVAPCEDQTFTEFLLRWHHIGGQDATPGVEGVAEALDQLAGVPFPPKTWEDTVLPARLPDYRPEWLDLLCMSGRVRWMALPSPAGEAAIPAQVIFVPRGGTSGQLLDMRQDPEDPVQQAILRALGERGAQFLDELADRAGVSERSALSSLWQLAALGWVTNDSFGPLRMVASVPKAVRSIHHREISGRQEAALRARLKSSLSGRWSMIEPPRPPGDDPARAGHDLCEQALVLLRRHGILAREAMAGEGGISWSDIYPTLRRLEYSGGVRRGYFVRSMSGEQYALPDAVESLRAVAAGRSGTSRPVALAANDPANPFGLALSSNGIAREGSNLIVIDDGRLLLSLSGRELRTSDGVDREQFEAGVEALTRLRPRLEIERIDGENALQSEWVELLAAMLFHSNGRALVFDKLPGPVPVRAALKTVR